MEVEIDHKEFTCFLQTLSHSIGSDLPNDLDALFNQSNIPELDSQSPFQFSVPSEVGCATSDIQCGPIQQIEPSFQLNQEELGSDETFPSSPSCIGSPEIVDIESHENTATQSGWQFSNFPIDSTYSTSDSSPSSPCTSSPHSLPVASDRDNYETREDNASRGEKYLPLASNYIRPPFSNTARQDFMEFRGPGQASSIEAV
jgi:hypothetical protein